MFTCKFKILVYADKTELKNFSTQLSPEDTNKGVGRASTR
jgi:hypothetical protein